ncbi:poly-gamma-glutamate hydrolase family protein [Pseudomonas bijieensis]|uniref:poly-gamma-glutamate hydrolase family protein n=1 Tax=Pseudomonas bijieensis TaxID=2681983 RepID=UPI00200F7459|nr:poly-gamma-glutamate hydrolase family protein [Pseudomonas bijieensis]UQI31265.1 poly-gamma-glutamate hydrolase family protein [Pseudomonas bijieensis]
MSDKYVTFADLSSSEPDGAYRIEVRQKGSTVALIAPHGGKIEFGTSEICRDVAGEDLTYYLFEGCKSSNNRHLHITSSRFDEPQGIEVAQSAQVVLTFHGQNGNEHFVNVGGLAVQLCASVICHLKAAGFIASQRDDTSLQGRDKNNICNRGGKGQGLQLEISRGLRGVLTSDKGAMARFSSAIRSALDEI